MSNAMDYETETGRFEDEQRFEGRRTPSPRPRRDEDERRNERRSASPNGRLDNRGPPPDNRSAQEKEESARNPGSNLFVTGIHPSLSEAEVSRLFEKYGEVEKCAIMLDPHTKESRGFGFVKMVTSEQADAAKEGLQGEVFEGRTLSIEKARRSRPRTPTPGKYFGPPKRDDMRRPPPGRYGDRFDDRRRGGYGGRDDYYSYHNSRYEDRDRYYSRREPRDRDEYGPRGIDRYAGGRDGGRDGREDRYNNRGDDRRGGSAYYDRDNRYSNNAAPTSYGDPASQRDSREPFGGRVYENRSDDRYSRR